MLEDANYTGIGRNSSNARFYTDENLKVLRELISYKDSGFMTLNDAAKAITERINGIDVMDVVTQQVPNIAQQQDVGRLQDAVLQLTEHIQNQSILYEQNMGILLQEIQDIKNELKEIREVSSVIEEVAATVEVEEKPKGLFMRLFGK
nr:hypothetical protein [Sporosarcina sp.]